MRINVGTVKIDRFQKDLVNEVLSSTRLTYGPMTEQFEKEWAKLHGIKYALFTNSGTSALQVALHALKEKYGWSGGEVIIPSVTFVATMNIVLQNNMKPVFVDVDKYFNIDPELIEEAITPDTKAIIAVHLLGQPAQMDRIMKIAKRFGLKVVEDSCETVGAKYAGKPVGCWGDVSCFSTYASHLVVTGVGGFACTNDDDLALRIKGLYNHGRDGVYHSIDSKVDMSSRFNFIHSGYSYRLTEMEAALGLGHMKRFNKELGKRRKNADYLITELDELELDGHIELPYIHNSVEHSWMLFPIVSKDRDKLISFLEEKGIATRYLMPLLSQPITKRLFGNLLKKYPMAEKLEKQGFLIGIHQDLTQSDLNFIVKCFREFYG